MNLTEFIFPFLQQTRMTITITSPSPIYKGQTQTVVSISKIVSIPESIEVFYSMMEPKTFFLKKTTINKRAPTKQTPQVKVIPQKKKQK